MSGFLQAQEGPRKSRSSGLLRFAILRVVNVDDQNAPFDQRQTPRAATVLKLTRSVSVPDSP